ncbi:Protein phosphatase 2C 37 [Camellia lanceoleosa]|uniref:Protein phosphatase 2C 37 n=1 Tax=Camellia lanceoleosa TaxID=1840588 RepID=A0ACC0FE64_9ERIC|nr:Protein phosphatase 2C 37 [Camellia lanceoleosa]
MAKICCRVVSDSEASTTCELSSQVARRRGMEIQRFKYVANVALPETSKGQKHKKLEHINAVNNSSSDGGKQFLESKNERSKTKESLISDRSENLSSSSSSLLSSSANQEMYPKFGVASVCGRRRDMEVN